MRTFTYPQSVGRRWGEQNAGGSAYKRNILGEWAAEGGLVFDILPKYIYTGEPITSLSGVVGVDVGTVGTTAALLFAPDPYDEWKWVVVDEYIWNGKGEEMLSEEEHIRNMIAKGWDIIEMVVDPSGKQFMSRARNEGINVFAANNDVLKGVHATNNAFTTERLKIQMGLLGLMRSASSYMWSTTERELPKKNGHEHACDALRYGALHLMPPYDTEIYVT